MKFRKLNFGLFKYALLFFSEEILNMKLLKKSYKLNIMV